MSKITRLDQLENENSIYRVSGVFDKSEVCEILLVVKGALNVYMFDKALAPYDEALLLDEELMYGISTGKITIMCLQRGEPK